MPEEAYVSQVPTGPAPVQVVDGTAAALAAARAKAVAKATGATPPAPVVSTVDASKPPVPPKIDMDAATLKTLTKQAAALRRAEARVVELEAGSKDVTGFAAAKKLYGEGKRLEAIAMLSGNDPSAEMEALMGAYLDSKPPEEVDPVAAEVAALKADNEARKAADLEAKKLSAERELKARDASIQGFAWSVLDAEKLPDGSPKFELCSLPKNRGESAVAALAVVKIFAAKEYPDGNVTPDQAKELYRKAFAEVEAEYEKDYSERLGARFVPRTGHSPRPVGQPANAWAQKPATPAAPPAEPSRANHSPDLSRPSISTQSYPKSLTPAQALAKAIERVKGFRQ
jgi:hypothetical protein